MDDRRAVSCGNALVSSLHRLLRDEEVAGSNPVTPTNKCPGQTLSVSERPGHSSCSAADPEHSSQVGVIFTRRRDEGSLRLVLTLHPAP